MRTIAPIFLGISAILAGCETPYQMSSPNHYGYTDRKLADGAYWITSEVNLETPRGKAMDYWMTRARELCAGAEFQSSVHQTKHATYGQTPFVEGIARCSGSTAQLATVKDLVMLDGPSKALVFYVDHVNDLSIDNSLDATMLSTAGKGMNVVPTRLERSVLAEGELLLTLRAKVFYAAPILDMVNFGKHYEAGSSLRFVPKADGVYVVSGRLGESGSKVWLEDEKTGEEVGTLEPLAAGSAGK